MRGKRVFIGLRALAIFAVSLLVTSSWAATKWHEKVLHSFGNGLDGTFPTSGLIFDAAGNLYGTTYRGGSHNYGTVFELTPNGSGGWTSFLLHSFGSDGDGQQPWAGLIFDAAGNLYGTTLGLDGAAFELMPNGGHQWTETALYRFGFNGGPDGQQPWASLVFDASGNLYGTTGEGGSFYVGTAFELTPNGSGSWTETQIYSFGNGSDGTTPVAGMIFDASGNLYGTTSAGGTYGFGTVFELTPNGSGSWTETVLYNFGPAPDGQEPLAGLVFDAAGNLYGTTEQGGNLGFPCGTYGCGTVFELTPNGSGGWTETILHRFGYGTDGLQPLYGSLIFDAAGNLYGTTREGGTYSTGTVFELMPNGDGSWTETVLYSFGNGMDGFYPFGSLTFDAAGNLYGTTDAGGTYDLGTVFELTPIHPCIRCSHAGLR